MAAPNPTATALGALAALIGVILLAAGALIAWGTSMFWLHLAGGVLLLALGALVIREAREGRYVAWAGVVLAFVGIGILISPLVWRPTVTWHAWVNYVTGALLIILGGYDAYQAQESAVERRLAHEE